jgi:hypothetical protein
LLLPWYILTKDQAGQNGKILCPGQYLQHAAQSMADDREVLANGTLPRQEVQRDHPGSLLTFASGSAKNRITVGA